uniref:UspA domain-containing protein n=1 Tax=Paramoeba aestuarina TaxID=180227 RepID=A0A7S4K455_9EUKA|mmetsp:Transcript_15369/g.24046  ORF Transcript_15369/g.24046 Transcript_15369/m.24046 type:complete len:181 (+) Transcript_15369:352-894(+)|eukprot:CAMPEP_0201508386 /NCGR_PEP_ID=MMETSP0161_2-20130828/1770_1 /ASSEMBLY_ACC=CAM_ASM_000251 /TAXON_ID=180227 /ORGANISM="Neoparamoeba aestuarina, Strain SoJaBio B1-5/56/2" /LENGTH=180 /DNA_ID=CAMNT_0047903037 /DNA_START=264 /DNA_END=806 /DNA_ORIENTATION=-
MASAVGRRYLVAIDSSENSHWDINYVLSVLDSSNDELHLLTVPPAPPSNHSILPISQPTVSHNEMVELWKEERKKSTQLLRNYAKYCHSKGVGKIFLVVGNGPVKDVVCGYVENRKVDFLVMGRRKGLGKVERFFEGSNSKDCVEDADCNIIVIKRPFGERFEFEEGEEGDWKIHEFASK